MNKNIDFLLITIILILLTSISIIEDNLAIIIAGTIIYTSILLFIQFLKRNRTAFYIFNITSLFFLIHLIFIHYGLINFYDTKLMKPDESFFYQSSNNVIQYIENGYNLFDINNLYKYHEMPAYIYLSGNLSILANKLGENSIFIQKLLVIFTAASIASILYLILIKYVDSKRAFLGTLYFGLFTHLTFLSSLLLRDIFIAFTFILFFYLLLSNFSLKNLVIMIITFFISFYLRVETGIFLFSLSLIYFIYLLNKTIKTKTIRNILIIVLIATTSVLLYYINMYDIFLKIYASSGEHALETASKGSLALKLKSIPYGIGNIALSIFSQLQPFPFWLELKNFSILAIFSAIGGFTWFFIAMYTSYGVLKMKILKTLDIKLVYLFYASIIYIILLSSSEGVIRRLIVVYPIIFTICIITYTNMTANTRKKVFLYGLSIYIVLHIIYLLLKL